MGELVQALREVCDAVAFLAGIAAVVVACDAAVRAIRRRHDEAVRFEEYVERRRRRLS